MGVLPKASDHRKADHPIEPIFLHRWSPRAMSGEPVSRDELNTLFEAARWAPSSYNEQPWRFLYARRDDAHWPVFLDLLVPANRQWAHQAGALLLIVARKTFSRNDKPNPVHSFDAGAAWANLANQGARMGLVVHGMAGFDWDKARTVLNVPEAFAVQAMVAVGRPGDPDLLPAQLRQAEVPTDRRPVAEFAFHGGFPD
jgi:nitroreductase